MVRRCRNDTAYSHFDNGWVKSSADPWDIVTTYGYNDLGQQTARTLTSAGGSSSRTMSWDFFGDGKLKARSDDGVPVGLHVSLVDNSDTGDVDVAGTWATSSTGTGFQGTDYRTQPRRRWSTDRLHVEAECAGRRQVHGLRPLSVGGGCVCGGAVRGEYRGESGRVHLCRGDDWVGVLAATTGTVVADAVKVVRDNTGEADDMGFRDYSPGLNRFLTRDTSTVPSRSVTGLEGRGREDVSDVSFVVLVESSGPLVVATGSIRTRKSRFHHTVVVKEGRVYDQFTGRNGMPIGDWKAQWQPNDLDFGF